MKRNKNTDKSPKALTRMVTFQKKLMTNKQKIDLLINEMGFIINDIKTLPLSRGLKVYFLKGKGKVGYSFDRVAEQKYIDQIFKEKGITYVSKAKPQNLKRGDIAIGPSHEDGGIKVKTKKGQVVAEIEGNEIVINAEASAKNCEKLSEINQSAGNGIAFNCDNKDEHIHVEKAERGEQIRGCHHPVEIAAKGAQIKKPAMKKEHESFYNINKEIEKLIDEKGDNPDNYTTDQKNFLRQYSGYGGLVTDKMSLEEAKASFTEFYTPDLIVQKMWALAYKYGFQDGQSVLEPSVGTGQFLKYVPDQSIATGYEINKYSYIICKILYPKFNFYHQPFEDIFIKNRDSVRSKIADLKKYDLNIGNPPYGDVGGFGMGMGEKQYTKSGNWIEYFLIRGLDLLVPGGLLIYIIGTEVANGGIPFLQQGPSKAKEMIAERADLLDAYRLPNGVFDRTDVLSDILVFKRK